MSDNDELPEFMREAFRVILERKRPQIQEHDFIRYFLDGFAGKIENVPLEKWLDVAGNAMNEVEVCKGDEVLFVVPPLMGPIDIKTEGGRAFAISEVIAKAQKLNYIHPNQGKAYMDEMLGSRIGHREEDLIYIRRWNEIFARYDLPTIPLKQEQKNTPQTDNTSNQSFDEYEDF